MPYSQGNSKPVAKQDDSSLSIRRARWEDMKKVAGFIRSSADWYREFVDEKDMAEHEVGEDWMTKNYFRREFYVGYEGKDAVGTISMQVLRDHAYLGYIYLDVEHVGKGFGHQLMEYAKERARWRGLKGMVLIAHPQAKWATKAYEKFGFKRIAADKEEVLAWQDGALKEYYEEGFELYKLPL